jgi:hypothetical protein
MCSFLYIKTKEITPWNLLDIINFLSKSQLLFYDPWHWCDYFDSRYLLA